MDDGNSSAWLVEVFVVYQESIDRRVRSGSPTWLKDALEEDLRSKGPVRDAAAQIDSL
jgi:hypothetical protein